MQYILWKHSIQNHMIYTVSQKKGGLHLCPQLWQMLTDFQNSFTVVCIQISIFNKLIITLPTIPETCSNYTLQ